MTDTASLAQLLGASLPCDCGRPHTVELARAMIEPGALEHLVPVMRELGAGNRVAVLADRVTRVVSGDKTIRELTRAGFEARLVEVADGEGQRPHATAANVERVRSGLHDRDFVVAVGAGTINDLAKLASFQQGIPYAVVPTAPSMNGYTSAIAAILDRGVKRTVACHQPVALFADLDVITAAPRHLIAAGLGDLESKPTATADYRLAAQLRGEHYCAVPEQVVLRAEREAAAAAQEIGQGDPQAIAVLFEALVLSGISMKLAGSSGPASGGEHLLSHFWDMSAPGQGRVEGWHGSQVGVATIVTAALYEELAQLNPGDIDPESLLRQRPGLEQQVEQVNARWQAHGEEVAAELRAKHLEDNAQRLELTQIKQDWSSLWSGLSDVLRPADTIRTILTQAGAPTTMVELGLTEAHLVEALRHGREIRRRFTVLDLAFELGVARSLETAVIQRSRVLLPRQP